MKKTSVANKIAPQALPVRKNTRAALGRGASITSPKGAGAFNSRLLAMVVK